MLSKKLIQRAFAWTLHPQPNEHQSKYYLNPEESADRLLKLVAHHDMLENKKINLTSTFRELGIDDLSKVELFLEIEREFYIEFPDKVVERFKNFQEVVDYVSQSFHTM